MIVGRRIHGTPFQSRYHWRRTVAMTGACFRLGHGEVGNTPDDLDFEARYEALRTAYLAALPQRRAEAAEHWRACMQDAQAPAWRELHTLVHRLSGSAPCYGLEEVGATAQKLDRMLSGKPPCRDVAALAPWMDCLLSALAAVTAAA